MKIVCFKNITHSIYFTPWHTEFSKVDILGMIHFQTILFYYFFHIFECSIDSNSLFLKIWKKKFADRAFLMVTWRPRPFSKKLPPWIFFIKIIPESHFNQRIASNKSLHRNIKFMPQWPALNCHVGDRKILISPKYIQN